MSFGRIFITGGTGYIGKCILDYRRRNKGFLSDAELVFLSRHPDEFNAICPALAIQPGVSFLQGDVRNFDFPTGRFDAVINAASPVLGAASEEETESVNVLGTKRVLELARLRGVKRILVTSSGAVYGKQDRPITESDGLNPSTAYGQAKAEVENLCIDSGISTGIARIFAQIGPHIPRRSHYAIGNFLEACATGTDLIIKGDGTPSRSYMYADDLVEWLFAILERGKPGRAYNVGSPAAVSIRDLAETVRETLHSTSRVRILGQAVSGAADYYVPDVDRIQSELGMKIKVNLRDAILLSAGNCPAC